MNFKKYLFFVMAAILAVVMIGCSSDDNSGSSDGDKTDGEITLKVATYFASTSPIAYDYVEPFMERVTELTDGKVQFDYFPAEQLGKAADLMTLTRDRVADISVFPPVYVSSQMPLTGAITFLPGVIETPYEGTMALLDLIENETLLEIDYKPNGIVPISAMVSPPDEVWTKSKEIRVPSDLKGMKVRSSGGVTNDLLEYIGATPVTIAFPEIYESLERGVLDVLFLYSLGLKNASLDELLEYAVMPHLGTPNHTMAINESVWEGLPEDVQEAMLQAGKEVAERVANSYIDETIAFDEAFVNDGKTIVELTDAEKAEWRELMDNFNEQWLEENSTDDIPYKEIFEEYKANVEKYK